jgi:hypothetical protein
MGRSRQRMLAVTGVAVLLAACAGSQGEPPTKDNLLAQAGFVRRAADTPERLAALRALPPHQFVMRNSNGSVKYLYADPTACGCIYVGGQQAYNQYRQMMTARVSADRIRAILSITTLPGEEGL